MNVEGHGGECCGITHIFNFYQDVDREKRDLRQSIEDVEDEFKHDNDWYESDGETLLSRRFNRVFEVVLTDQQLAGERGQQRADLLKANGFSLVTRFVNDNSGNICNIFHRSKRLSRRAAKLPFKW